MSNDARTIAMETEAHRPQQATNSHSLLSKCNRHPDEQVTGFCASCLRERLAGLDNANAGRSSTSSAASSSAALKTIFFRPAIGVHGRHSSFYQRRNGYNKNTAISTIRPELSRSKSFAGGPRAAAAVEPQRRSCDVRVRSTLSSLFHQEDRDRIVNGGQKVLSSSAKEVTVLAASDIEAEADSVVIRETSKDELEDVRPMKDHIDLDSYSQTKKIPSRDIKEIAGSFWLAASIFSKKLQKWRRKQQPSKSSAEDGGISKRLALRPEEEKPPVSSRRFRDAQSEIAVDAFGRRSCDIAPRFSLDAGRISFDDQRYSLDEPRASWDGCLISSSGRYFPSRLPAKLAVVEDAVQRSDGLIPVEEDKSTPGCSAQTRDYYSDSSGRRRRSLDRSSSSRRHSVVLCESKSTSNSNIPELFHWTKLERESKIWGSNSLREDFPGSFDSTFKDPINTPPVRKSRLWSIWGFIHRHNGSRAAEPQVMERSFSETWPELRVTGTTMQRSSSTVSARRSCSTNGGLSNTLKSGFETTCPKMKKKKKKKKSKELVLDKSRSARYSPSHFDNGLLRFYLTPTRGGWRSGVLTKNKFSSPRSFTSSILRLY